MSIEKVLVVAGDESSRTAAPRHLEQIGVESVVAANDREATQILGSESIDLVLSDLQSPDFDSVQFLHWVKSNMPEVPVVLMCGDGTLSVAKRALEEGADDVVVKPLSPDQLALLLQRMERRLHLVSENHYLRSTLEPSSGEIVGRSPAIQEVVATVRRVAPTKAAVLIRGGSGTGKKLVAHTLHSWSARKDKPFVRIHCAAHPDALLDLLLFGHERGAVGGSPNRRMGYFDLAADGLILLEEISEMSPRVQGKLLRALEAEVFERAGGDKAVSTRVRIVATSSRSLEEVVKTGMFREDLYRRLQSVSIVLPPLCERKEDIGDLARLFLERSATRHGCPSANLTSEAIEALEHYHWPGNVRELLQLIERAVVIHKDRVLDVDDLGLPAAGDGATQVGRTVEDVERELILRTLTGTHGNRTRAAEILGVTPRTICNKIRLYRAQGYRIPEPQRPVKAKEGEPVTAAAGVGATEERQSEAGEN